jgi:Family of unknown function (DUF6220)
MSTVARVHRGLAFFFLAVGIVAFFLAGLGAFGSESFDAHRGSGSLLLLVSLVLLILAAVGRREALQQSGVLFALMVVQMLLAIAGEDVGILAGLHPVNGLIILFVAHQAARGLPLSPAAPARSRAAA